jgi:formate hydrogenlyase subunit 3/multisubunit Na+/H+ antiporter MnhD subunit
MRVKQLSRLRKALWLWIIVGAVIVAHAVIFSGGVVEPFLLWQLERYQAVDEGTTMLALLAIVVGLPALILTLVPLGSRKQALPFNARRKRKGLIGSGVCILILAALGMIALVPVLSRLSAADQTLVVMLGTLKEPPPEVRATATGVPRPNYTQLTREPENPRDR